MTLDTYDLLPGIAAVRHWGAVNCQDQARRHGTFGCLLAARDFAGCYTASDSIYRSSIHRRFVGETDPIAVDRKGMLEV